MKDMNNLAPPLVIRDEAMEEDDDSIRPRKRLRAERKLRLDKKFEHTNER